MSKHKGKEKKIEDEDKNRHKGGKKKHNKDRGESANGKKSESLTVRSGQDISEANPLDRVTYLEAKLILKPDRFTSMQAFRDFGKIVQKLAKKVGVGFVADPEAGLRPKIREIVFGDTPDFRLYNNAFILRRRISCTPSSCDDRLELMSIYRESVGAGQISLEWVAEERSRVAGK